jgi:hypothetical protein
MRYLGNTLGYRPGNIADEARCDQTLMNATDYVAAG